MRRPGSQWEQYEGKAIAELSRGCGQWPIQVNPCFLEPPFEEFDRKTVTVWDCLVNDWESGWENWGRVYDDDRAVVLDELAVFEHHSRVAVKQYAEDESTIDKALQLLLSLPQPMLPISFEISGRGVGCTQKMGIIRAMGEDDAGTSVEFVCHPRDAATLQAQLQAQYPSSSFDVAEARISGDPVNYVDRGWGTSLFLNSIICCPLKTYGRLDNDPLGVVITAMDELEPGQWATLQILFEPAQESWEFNFREAVRHPYKGTQCLFSDLTERDVDAKCSSPLFAVAIRIAASTRLVYDQLLGWAGQFSNPPQSLKAHDESEGEDEEFIYSLQHRYPLRPGVLLNAEELASLVHLPGPGVVSERLPKVASRTKAAPASVDQEGSVVLGINEHRGQRRRAVITAKLRPRHCWIGGASGTGKSTLLLNMMKQDIEAGCGVGLLDPHGDLAEQVLEVVPQKRIDDVVYFNPGDREFPPALNILQHGGDDERERLATEVVTTFHKFYPAGWGARLEHILTHALMTVLHCRGATLFDVRRILVDEEFRAWVLAGLAKRGADETLMIFWEHDFASYKGEAITTVLNKLSPFMTKPIIRNIISQRRAKFDFDAILNGRKIFIANLSKGKIGDEALGMLGTFIMSKIVGATFRRAEIPEGERVPWYLYVDEFQNFMNLSVGVETVLSEARKFKLALLMANQFVDQLSAEVRSGIFGNVGTLMSFRLGTTDARMVSNEFGEFTEDELKSLEVGEAIARVGGSQNSFNLKTFDRPSEMAGLGAEIVRRSRRRYTTPRAEVDRQFASKRPVGERKTVQQKKRAGQVVAEVTEELRDESISPDEIDSDLI